MRTIKINTLAHFILVFCNIVFVVPMIIAGFIWGNRRFFFELSCLLLVGMTVNVALKFYFHIYLPNGVDYAFPSGHMQLATLLYGYIALSLYLPEYSASPDRARRVTLLLLLAVLTASIGWAMVWCGYHTALDAAGGFITALLLIGWFRLSLVYMPNITSGLAVLLSTIAMIYSYTHYGVVPLHAWMAYAALPFLVVIQKSGKLFCPT